MKTDTLKNIIILILLAAVAYLFFNKPEERQEEIITENDLNGTITPEKARELQAEFINTRAKMFSDSLGYEDSRSFTMSVSKMDSFTKYIKDTYPKLPNLGLRFYLGKYGKKESNENEQTTMFIAPTGVLSKESLASLKGKTVGAKLAKADDNIYEIAAYNGGFAGVPPKKY